MSLSRSPSSVACRNTSGRSVLNAGVGELLLICALVIAIFSSDTLAQNTANTVTQDEGPVRSDTIDNSVTRNPVAESRRNMGNFQGDDIDQLREEHSPTDSGEQSKRQFTDRVNELYQGREREADVGSGDSRAQLGDSPVEPTESSGREINSMDAVSDPGQGSSRGTPLEGH